MTFFSEVTRCSVLMIYLCGMNQAGYLFCSLQNTIKLLSN